MSKIDINSHSPEVRFKQNRHKIIWSVSNLHAYKAYKFEL